MMKQEQVDRFFVGGSGGGGKGKGSAARVAVEEPDSLRSIEYARVIDLVSEGEIEGPADPDVLKATYLNGVVVRNTDGTDNFSGVTLDYRVGTQTQNYMAGFPSQENEVAVGVQVTKLAPVTRTISNVNVDRVRVTIGFPALTHQDQSTGDLTGTSVEFSILVQTDNGGFILMTDETVTGKVTARYQREYMVTLPKPGTEWQIKVVRITDDNPPSNIQNQTFWDSYTEIIDVKIRYVNRAVFGLEIDASQFNAIPTRGYLIKGIRVRVPTNYNPVTRVYTGIWDGSFKIAWTDNPVWCYYDLLTNTRYGLGEFIDDVQVDKFGLYVIGKYCDELVPNGFGGTEPRFVCNLYIENQDEAYKVLQAFAAIFRAMSFWSNGSLITAQDAPSTPFNLYAPANVIDSKFAYQGSALTVRHTVALVTWNDPEDQYKQTIEYVEDEEGIQRYGYVKTDTTAFACTSRGQAHRWGKWLLASERLETEIITFSVGYDGILAPPGSIIMTTDPSRAGMRLGGRLISATANTVTLDQPVTLQAGQAYEINAVTPSGFVEVKTVTNGAGTFSVLNLSSNFAETPQPYAMWVLSSDNIEPELWRVVAVTEAENGFAVTGVTHVPGKYDFVEDGTPLETRITTAITRPPAPQNLNITQTSVENAAGQVEWRATFSWSGLTGHYFVQYKQQNGNWSAPIETFLPSVELDFLPTGHYTFTVVQVNAAGLQSQPATLEDDIVTGLPSVGIMPDVTGLELFGLANKTDFVGKDAKFTWRRTSIRSPNEGSPEPLAFDGSPDSGLRDYAVHVYDETGVLLRMEFPVDNVFEYTYEKNREDNLLLGRSGAVRKFTVKVWARGRGNPNPISLHAAELTVQNPPPPLPMGVSLVGIFKHIFFDYIPPGDSDYDHIIVWLSTLAGFAEAGRDIGEGNVVYSGNDKKAIIPVDPDQTYYMKYAAVDTFGADSLIISGELTVTTGMIEETDIRPESITTPLVRADSIVAGKAFFEDLASVTAFLGDVTAGTITMGAKDYIRGGQSYYNEGVGVFLGYNEQTGKYVFSVGDPNAKHMKWDGGTLTVGGDVIVTGNLVANSVSGGSAAASVADLTVYDSSALDTLNLVYQSSGFPLLLLGNMGWHVHNGQQYVGPVRVSIRMDGAVIQGMALDEQIRIFDNPEIPTFQNASGTSMVINRFAPAPGIHTFTLRLSIPDGTNVSVLTAQQRAIVLLELKR